MIQKEHMNTVLIGDDDFMRELIRDNYPEEGKHGMSVRQLQRKLKALTDQQPNGYLRLYRLGRSQALLLQGRRIGEVAYAVGFASPAHFASCFRAKYGCTPTEYQAGHGQASST